MSVGLDHIDIPECRKRGIHVGYTPNVLTEGVADMAIGLLLAASRRYKEGEHISNEFSFYIAVQNIR